MRIPSDGRRQSLNQRVEEGYTGERKGPGTESSRHAQLMSSTFRFPRPQSEVWDKYRIWSQRTTVGSAVPGTGKELKPWGHCRHQRLCDHEMESMRAQELQGGSVLFCDRRQPHHSKILCKITQVTTLVEDLKQLQERSSWYGDNTYSSTRNNYGATFRVGGRSPLWLTCR